MSGGGEDTSPKAFVGRGCCPWGLERQSASLAARPMADANAEAAAQPTDYVRVKRKKITIFLNIDPKLDTVHDLRARINHITKVPTTDVKFFIDKDGEVPIDENKYLGDQSVSAEPRRAAPRPLRLMRLTAHGSRRSGERVRGVGSFDLRGVRRHSDAPLLLTLPRSLNPLSDPERGHSVHGLPKGGLGRVGRD